MDAENNDIKKGLEKIIGDATIRLSIKSGEKEEVHIEGKKIGLLYLLALMVKNCPAMLPIMEEAIEYSKARGTTN